MSRSQRVTCIHCHFSCEENFINFSTSSHLCFYQKKNYCRTFSNIQFISSFRYQIKHIVTYSKLFLENSQIEYHHLATWFLFQIIGWNKKIQIIWWNLDGHIVSSALMSKCHWNKWIQGLILQLYRPWHCALFQYKDYISRYKDSHNKDKMAIKPSYLYDGNPYAGKASFLY